MRWPKRPRVSVAAVADRPPQGVLRRVLERLRGKAPADKGDHELDFWRERVAIEGTLTGPHYRSVMLEQFGLAPDFYAGTSVLDLGCGPRGSLEWCDAPLRVGLDPLAVRYLELGTATHAMDYVASGGERMPFRAGAFDVVTSMNSLDHVDDLDATIAEIIRVLRPGGTLLLVSEVNHDPSPTEPISFGFDIVDRFAPALSVLSLDRFELRRHDVHASTHAAVPYDATQPGRPGVVRARLQKIAEG